MAEEKLPECVIVSSNRYLDIEPYCNVIYNAEPDKWGDIFPWEFPQNGTKEQEEGFLRLFFSDTEIHMQGGAHGPGNGFKFLKQVWYCIAMWNLHHRVPAVANWWWERPDNRGVSRDKSMLAWIAKTEPRPDLFFELAEIRTYGTKLLGEVIQHIRRTAEVLLVRPTEPTLPNNDAPASPTNDPPGPSTTSSQTVCRDVTPPELSNIRHQQVTVEADMSQPTEAQSRAVSASSTDFNSPIPSTGNPARSRAASSEYPPPPQDFQGQSKKRANSGYKRYNNNRGNNFQNRMPYLHDQQMLPSPVFSNMPPSRFHHPRVPPGGLVDFIPAHSPGLQGQPPMMGHPGPQQFGQQPFMHPNEVASPMHFMQGHPHNFAGNQPFDDRTNNQFPPRQDMFEPQYTGDKSNFAGSYRRNSQTIRGKPRANTGFRGRGSRGRNSFSTSDQQPPNFPHNQNFDPTRFDHPPGQPVYVSNRDRRGSIFGEKNWRSGSEHPQVPPAEQRAFKENNAPSRDFSGVQHPYVATAGAMDSGNEMGETRFDAMQHPLNSVPRLAHGPPSTTFNRGQFPQQPQIDYDSLTEDQKCGDRWIGKNCTFCLKLLAMNVPEGMYARDLEMLFNRFCKVSQVSKMPPPPDHNPEKPSIPVFWLNFSNTDEARKCLAMKPERWPNNAFMRIEVPKEYWDPTHHQFHRNFLSSSTIQPPPNYRPPEILRRLEGKFPQAESVGDRPEETTPKAGDNVHSKQPPDDTQSGETTPTPSAANTPKKKLTKGEKKKRKEFELLKMSLAASADQQTQPANAVETSNPAPKLISEDNSAGSNQRIDSGATEIQTSSEPSFTPTDIIETRLPAPIDTAPKESQRSASGQTEVQTTSEPSFTPTTQIATRLPPDSSDNPQLFRADKKTEEKKEVVGEVAGGEQGQPKPSDAESKKQVRESQRTSDDDRIDDSFHTASDSPAITQVSGVGATDVITPAESKGDASSEKTVAVTAPPEKSANAELDTQSAAILPTASPEVNKGKKKVQIPQLEMKSAKGSAKDAGGPTESALSNQRNTSTGSDAPLTSAYVTAPNTPRVPGALSPDDDGSDDDDDNTSSAPLKKFQIPEISETIDRSEEAQTPEKAENTEISKKSEISQTQEISKKQETSKKQEISKKQEKSDKTEKQEKPKGPAQTESLSLFGKKKSKDTKPKSKKGTLRGKPKMDDTASSDIMSGNTSRVVSSAEPVIGTDCAGAPAVIPTAAMKTDGEEMLREDSRVDNSKKSEPKDGPKSETAIIRDGGNPRPLQQESPKKHRGGFLGHLTNIFGGGQQTHTPPRHVADNTLPDQSLLTGSKTQNRPLSIDTTALVDGSAHTTAVGRVAVEGMVRESIAKDEPVVSTVAFQPTQDAIALGTGDGDLTETTAAELNPVSDHTISAPIEDGSAEHRAKKNKKKGKRSKKKSVGNNGDATEPSTPTAPSADGKALPEMHVFGSGKTPPALEDVSDVSSQTLGRSTPTSDVQSPTAPTSSRKLPVISPGQGSLVEAKVPQWQKRKRQLHQRASGHDDAVESSGDEKEADDEEKDEAGKDKGLPTVIVLDPVPHKTLYVYFGQGKMGVEDNEEVDADLGPRKSNKKFIEKQEGDASD